MTKSLRAPSLLTVLTLSVCTVSMAHASGTITGVVVDPSGGAIAGAQVTLVDAGGALRQTTKSDSRGNFSFSGLPAGRYAIQVESSQFEPARTEVEIGSTPPSPVRITLSVRAVREELTVRAEGYGIPVVAGATKTDIPIFDTPVSIEVVPREVIDDQQAIYVDDAVKNISGVQRDSPYPNLYESFIVRGFPLNFGVYRNGVRQQVRDFETANLDRIEVLKGPAAVLYGLVEPGGVINLIGKPPQAKPAYAIQQQIGSYGFYRTTAEATGALTDDETLLYQLDLAYQNSDSFQDFVFLDRKFIAPSLAWKPTPETLLGLTYEYQDSDLNFSNGLPAIGAEPAPVPIGFSPDDGDDTNNTKRHLVDLSVSQGIGEGWRLRGHGQFSFADYDNVDVGAGALGADNRTLDRYLYQAQQERNGTAFSVDLTGRFGTGSLSHNVLVGLDYFRFSQETFGVCCPGVASLDIFDPVRGVVDEAALSATPNSYFANQQRWRGILFQDQVTLGTGLYVLAGGRYDWAKSGTSFSGTGFVDPNLNQDKQFSPRVGIVYQPQAWLSLYGNYVESFGRNNGRSASGEEFDPERGRQYEAGLKGEFWEKRLSSTLAFYQLTKESILTADITTPDPTDRVAIGEARSRGVELDVSGRASEAVSMIASLAYTDTSITRNTGGTQGNRFPNVPKLSGSFWARYAATPALTIATGVFGATKKEGDVQNTFELPGYARWDAMVSYRLNLGGRPLVAQVNVKNITDKEYYVSTNTIDGGPRSTILAADPLTVFGSIRVEF